MPDILTPDRPLHQALPFPAGKAAGLARPASPEPGLDAALDALLAGLQGVAVQVRPVPVSGPVGDDRASIACRDLELEEELALALWWNHPAGCQALAGLGGTGIIEHAQRRRVPDALRHAVTLIIEVEQHGFCAVTLWRRPGSRGLGRRELALLEETLPSLADAIGKELRRMGTRLWADGMELHPHG